MKKRPRYLGLLCLAILAIESPAVFAADDSNERFERTRPRAIQVLRDALKNETIWSRVHAAEALLFNNYPEDLYEAFEAELESAGPDDRIGIWNVLVRAAGNNATVRAEYLQKIAGAASDPDGADAAVAIETLAKLGHEETTDGVTFVAEFSGGKDQVYARWLLANNGIEEDEKSLASLLRSEDPDVFGTVGYALRHFDSILPATLIQLKETVSLKLRRGDAHVYLISALFVHAFDDTDAENRSSARGHLLSYLESSDAFKRAEACAAFAVAGEPSDYQRIEPLLDDNDVKVRIAAANALLRIERRQFRGLGYLDWSVIALYGAFILGVGFYYSRRQTSTEEYFLASRNMNPVIIGVSIFATLLSTITYLGYPGEMIKHGPILLSGMLSFPIAYVIIGYFLVPRIMQFRVTSAYEILEIRLGLSTRMVGSVVFIMTRLVWMGLLTFLTAKLIVEMLNWSPQMIPWIVVVAGITAVAYTTLGGLRAVIITDMFQFLILTGGALVTIILITLQLGGFSWFPTEWAQHWDTQPIFPKSLFVRATVLGTLMSATLWWICTAGSDQVAIQRYLATRDSKAARKAFLINLFVDVVVLVLLAIVGFALLGFFIAKRHLIPDGKNLFLDADFLFPRYIANYLPIGLAGLVVAGILAAAMSSLDSGINSIVTVVTRDFAERFGKSNNRGKRSLLCAKLLVVAIGILVVLCSSQMDNVKGNIVELTNKTNGLFVGPLFGLFIMAMFVRWSTSLGAIVGLIYGFATACIFAYWDLLTGAPESLSFQWIIPAALVIHIPIAMLVSLIPIKNQKRMLVMTYGIICLLPLVGLFWYLGTMGQ